MKKKTIRRGLFGLPIGIAIGFVITLFISACVGDGSFYPVTPELIGAMGNELNAVILQTVLCAVIGAGFAAASVIWELDSWSLAKQSGIYFLTISIIMLPVAYFANWMKHSLAGVLSYAGIFTAITRRERTRPSPPRTRKNWKARPSSPSARAASAAKRPPST